MGLGNHKGLASPPPLAKPAEPPPHEKKKPPQARTAPSRDGRMRVRPWFRPRGCTPGRLITAAAQSMGLASPPPLAKPAEPPPHEKEKAAAGAHCPFTRR